MSPKTICLCYSKENLLQKPDWNTRFRKKMQQMYRNVTTATQNPNDSNDVQIPFERCVIEWAQSSHCPENWMCVHELSEAFRSIEIIARLISEHVSKCAWLCPFHIAPFHLFCCIFSFISIALCVFEHKRTVVVAVFFSVDTSMIEETTYTRIWDWNIGRHCISDTLSANRISTTKYQLKLVVIVVAFNFYAFPFACV